MKHVNFVFVCFLFLFPVVGKSQTNYFPPISQTANWDTLSPSSLGWCQSRIDSLYDYLQSEGSKGFIILKDGKIVLEKYFGTFTQDSVWYWASAGKTLTGFLIGQAQDEGFLNIQDQTSNYLGAGWSNCSLIQENQIKIVNQLSMNTGLDDGVPDNSCTIDTCLNYLAPVATRWAYHNAPYTLLEQVIENATTLNINQFTNSRISQKTGISGLWVMNNFNNVFYSKVRAMARFGLLVQNNGIWNQDTLLKSNSYKNAMHNPSQNLNKSYGYLWWLNGYASYMLPGTQVVVPGSICPDAPSDMYSGIGKNGQLVSIAPSQNMVMVRMGENANNAPVSTILLNNIWKQILGLSCTPSKIEETDLHSIITLFPNPVNNELNIQLSNDKDFEIEVTNIIGNKVFRAKNMKVIDVSDFKKGFYFLKVSQDGKSIVKKFSKQ